MAKPLSGVRILELASHVFVPIAGGILTEQGAEVIKIENPDGGDPYRGLITAGFHKAYHGIDASFQLTNRGKQSVTVDLKKPEGRDLIYRLAKESDVFLTNFRPDARKKLKIDVADIRSQNPKIIYVRGTGYGARGPEIQRGGYDAAAYWSRGGHGAVFTPPGAEVPTMQRPAFGDVVGGLAIAGAISAALFRRATTGKPSVVDVSLLGTGMWQLQPDIVQSKLNPEWSTVRHDRKAVYNPLVGAYRTRDGRFIMLNMLEGERYWDDFCTVVGRPELITDPRFATGDARKENSRACVETLDEMFASRDYKEWLEILKPAKGVWAPLQTPLEVHSDVQVQANGYLADVEMNNGMSISLVTSPAQFDEEPHKPTRAPELGEHTESALLDLGLSWEEISKLKEVGAIG
jgi:crotonobetainyl-CoA:carnitine CoA-transferase CaiB-like acyl-CoA transferase